MILPILPIQSISGSRLLPSPGMWFGEIPSCCSLTVLLGLAWVLLKYVWHTIFSGPVCYETFHLPGHSTLQAWSSDVVSAQSSPPLAAYMAGFLVLVWSPVPSRALQEVSQLDQLAHSPITQLTGI